MRVFVSYASEYRRDADAVALALRQEGHAVFFDRDDLPAGEAYHARIRSAIEDSRLFLFLVSPESVEDKSYAMTELGLARKRWPNPSGHVLPVVVKPTPIQDIPEYLKAVTFVEPKGDLVADVVARVDQLARMAARRRMSWAIGAVLGLALAAGLIWVLWGKQWVTQGSSASTFGSGRPCSLWVTVRDQQGVVPSGMLLDVSDGATTQSFLVPAGEASPVQVGPLAGPTAPWKITVRSGDGSPLGSHEMRGCLTSEATYSLGGSHELVVKPRTP